MILFLAATLPHVSNIPFYISLSGLPVPFDLTLIAVLLAYLCNFLIVSLLSFAVKLGLSQ